jgi:hypothetical protein
MSQIIEILNKISEEVGALAPENNGGVPFKFRGIDATVSHLAPAMKKYGVVVIPNVRDRITTPREIGNSKVIKTTDILVDYTFYAPDGSSVTATTAGLADDFSDRSAAQAQSVAFRVALLQVFKLPTTDKEPEQIGEETQKYIADQDKAAKSTPAKAGPKAPTAAALRTEITKVIASTAPEHEAYGPEEINALGGKHSGGKKPDEWMPDAKVLAAILDSVSKGEVA